MLWGHLKVAFKVLLRRRFFTAVSLFGITLTLTVLMVASAMLDHVFGPHPPEVALDRSLGVTVMEMRANVDGGTMIRNGFAGYGFLDRQVRTLPDVERVAVFSVPKRVPVYRGERRQDLYLKRTDGAFWQAMAFEVLEGAPFTDEDDREARPVAVLNASTRERLFGDAQAVGEPLEIDGQIFRVVGVVADVPILRARPFSEVWVPIGTIRSDPYRRELVGDFMALVVAKDRADLPRIKAEVAARVKRSEAELPAPYQTLSGAAETLFESFARLVLGQYEDTESPAEILLGIIVVLMVLFMALPALNLVNLTVSRIMERAAEIGVRKAFGASTSALVLPLLAENVMLALAGGLVSLGTAYIALDLVEATGLVPYADFHLNLRIFAYGLALTLAFGVLSGLYPAWKMSRLHPVEALRGGVHAR